MKQQSVLKRSLLATAVLGVMAPAPAMAADSPSLLGATLSGSAEAANYYLWRGSDESDSAGAISGSLDLEWNPGFYTGAWVSSATAELETNLYGGFAGEANGFSYDVGAIQYRFSRGGKARAELDEDGELEDQEDRARKGADFQEFYVLLGYGGFGIEGWFGFGEFGGTDEDVDDNYYALTYGYDRLGAVIGYADFDDDDWDYTHLDLSYEIYDGLTFTYTKIVDEETEGLRDTTGSLHVAYAFEF